MATQSTKPAPVKAEAKPKVKRTQLTTEQRIAKAEAELEAIKAKAAAKQTKAAEAAKAKRDALVTKRDALNVQIAELTATIGDGAADVDAYGNDDEGDAS